MKLIYVLSVLSIILVSCAHQPHHNDVRPGVDGVHTVILNMEDKENSDYSQDAISQATFFCKQNGKMVGIISEEKKFVGQGVDEETYNTTKMGTKVAKVIGGTVWGMGGEKESDIGGVVGLGGQAVDSALGNGYQLVMKFKCQ